ncbi:hypothetical protein N7492_007916 [Penicillium capsulatum]|uniref:Monooxygenase n=1 Tax=Penicillium capsulatum TaxID=69766 RepID=A0A9W9I0S5_9EURO|nr:hypothetical protein N7492_007916 [Penicillium capsulatum]KAJ6117745.1 hypothetical protein N7512_007470 [Penicillium capsulatum]
MASSDRRFDVVIVGAGISGINSAYRMQTELPGYSYTILEARDDLGGTWDLFRYPGIRSDSDLFTFGFAFNPWPYDHPIAEGGDLKAYIRDTAEKFEIDREIQFRHKLESAGWSSEDHTWSLQVNADGKPATYTARFVIFGTGYYNYQQPLDAHIPGLDNFQGEIIHPQFWPEKLDYQNKKVVIIGSGATAITLLPNMAEQAERVTMLQRSPTYIINLPNRTKSWWLAYVIGSTPYRKFIRWFSMFQARLFFLFCQRWPGAARWLMNLHTSRELPSHIPLNPHFQPRYNPWDQRLCVSPDGDFFECLRRGKADVKTDTIKTVTKKGIQLTSGDALDADIIITATGLRMQMAGGSALSVDGEKIDIGSKFLWNGVMMQDLPNATFMIGYTNASWTLGADATATFTTRLLKSLESRKLIAATPRMKPNEESTLEERNMLSLTSTYVKVAAKDIPKSANRAPWQPRDHYTKDMKFAQHGNIDNGLEYVQGPSVHLRPKLS